MTIDNITIVLGAVVLLIALTTPWVNVFFRRPEIKGIGNDAEAGETADNTDETANGADRTGDEAEVTTGQHLYEKEKTTSVGAQAQTAGQEAALPPVTIILTPHENAPELERNLPLLLQQDYPAAFKVIVVAWKGDSDTEDVLKRYSDDKHLYWTYIPQSSRYMSRKKLAITLGVKAADTEWMLMTEITNKPDSNLWLRTVARNCTDDRNLVVGYTRYERSTDDYRLFRRLVSNCYLTHEMQHGFGYRCDSSCLMFRKSEFIEQEGFRGNLKYLRGEYDFMVNKYAREGSVAVENDPQGWMTEQEPTDKEWRNRNLFYIENRQHMQHSFRHRWRVAVDQCALHLGWLATFGTAVFAAVTQRWILCVAAVLAIIIIAVLRTMIAARVFEQWRTGIAASKAVVYETGLVWHILRDRIDYHRADKYDFISHKL